MLLLDEETEAQAVYTSLVCQDQEAEGAYSSNTRQKTHPTSPFKVLVDCVKANCKKSEAEVGYQPLLRG